MPKLATPRDALESTCQDLKAEYYYRREDTAPNELRNMHIPTSLSLHLTWSLIGDISRATRSSRRFMRETLACLG
jgi:hypothetical protein